MLDVETRAAERNDLRRQLHRIAEARRRDEARAGVDQRQAEDAERRGKLGRLHAEGFFKKRPGAPIEEFEKVAVEDDAGRVALAPFDGEMPPADEIGHARPDSAA